MQYFRIYAGPDGESHFEDVEVPMAAGAGASALSALIPAKEKAAVMLKSADGKKAEVKLKITN